ncbi:Ethanolamine utilisation protein EutQ [Bradyrhizobium sp. Rc2d]|uniref:hypothetical protein n=1 Tax=Bradyrhizobium sp. Rc2d TaxID=1855321 RepID=UPI000889F35F|nr:hypothetical protein [Bradyrhizobium sp. Rc2d]SDJ79573.1 Ethanolamine utilisation protein EutQ [Bradyrhizobium sp. Rc2d]
MTQKTTNEVVHITYPSMTWSRGYIHAGGDFFACRLITVADDPRGPGPAISTTLGAGITTYDGCSIEQTPPTMHDETFVVLGGNLRLLTGEDYSRVIEAKFGDVLWLPKGALWKFQGEKASIFYVVYPVMAKMRTPAVVTGASKPEAIHLKSQDMVFSQVHGDAGGHAASCQLVTPDRGGTMGVAIRTYDGCSIETTTTYDEAIVVLGGMLRILTDDNYSRSIEAKFSDVVWVPKGSRLKYQGDKAKVYSVRHP